MENKEHSKRDYEFLMHDILLKQQELLLKQYAALTEKEEKEKEDKDQVDLRRLVPGFLKKKKDKEGAEDSSDSGFKDSLKRANLNLKDVDYSGLKKTGNYLQKFFTGIANVFRYFYYGALKRIYFLIIFTILGLGYGIYIYKTAPPLYRSSMVLKSGMMSNLYYSGLIYTLKNLAEEESYKEISKKLNLSEEQAMYVYSIQYGEYLLLDEELEKENDTTFVVPDRPFFRVFVWVYDNSILEDLGEGIFSYLKDNRYAKRRRDIRKDILEQSLENTEKELNLLDSLKFAVITRIGDFKKRKEDSYYIKETGLETGTGIILSEQPELEIEPMLPFERSLRMYEERLDQRRQLLLIDDDFEIIEEFSAYQNPVFPTIKHVILYMIYGFIFGFLITVGITILFGNKRKKQKSKV